SHAGSSARRIHARARSLRETIMTFMRANPTYRVGATRLCPRLSGGRFGDRPPDPGCRSGEVEPIEVHDLVPCSHEVTHELLLGVVLCVDLRDGPKLGVRTEDEVDAGRGVLGLARGAIATLVHVFGLCGRLPLRAHVEQIHEEAVGQRLGPVGEDAVLGWPDFPVQSTHAADQYVNL